MITCTECKKQSPDGAVRCGTCGHPLSDPDARLDDMVEKAAVPNLASLFRKAKDSGAIKPVSGYGNAPSTN